MSLIAAVYAVIPRERRLDVRLRIDAADWVVVLLASGSILYLEFNDFFNARHWVLRRPWPDGITPANTIHLVLLGAVAILVIRFRYKRLSRGRIGKFRELVEQLYWEERYGELLTILQNNLPELFRLANADFPLVHLRKQLKNSSRKLTDQELRELVTALKTKPKVSALNPMGFLRVVVRRAASEFAELLPRYDRAQRVAQEIVRAILVSPRLARSLVRTRPYLGLDIIRQWNPSFERGDFINLYLSELVRDTNSVLYQEISNNQNILSGYRYRIPESNRVLHFFLSDAEFARKNAVYKPIGDYALAYLKELSRDATNDPYNRVPDEIPDIGENSPLHATLRFFDIMVQEALHQGTQWHMWLYYMPSIVSGIVRNYRLVDATVNPEDEFPTRYSFLLYEIFSTMGHWIEEARNVAPDSPNIVLLSATTDLENGNIPKSATLALSQCVRTIAESENLTTRFKRYLLDIVFHLYFELRTDKALQGYATVLRQALARGGTYGRRNDGAYQSAIRDAFVAERMEYSIKYPDALVEEIYDALNAPLTGL